jgi:hypothetical protein
MGESTRDLVEKRHHIENTETDPVCLVNTFQWCMEDLGIEITKIDFEKFRQERINDLSKNSDLKRKVRDAFGWGQPHKAEQLYVDAESRLIVEMINEVQKNTGRTINWIRKEYEPEQIDQLNIDVLLHHAEGMLMLPSHVEKLFPQPSPEDLIDKLKRSSDYLGGNVVLLSLADYP